LFPAPNNIRFDGFWDSDAAFFPIEDTRYGAMDPGKEFKVKSSTMICHESVYPQLARRFHLEGASLLVNITNDAWFGHSFAPYQHAAFLVMRAIENQTAIVRCANTGISGFVDSRGRWRQKTPIFTEANVSQQWRPDSLCELRRAKGFSSDGDQEEDPRCVIQLPSGTEGQQRFTRGTTMRRYLTILGIAIIAFGLAGGSIAISSAYNVYRSQLHVSGDPASNPLTVLDEAKWQAARLIGGGIIVSSFIAGSLLVGLGWIGATLEQIREALSGEPASEQADQG